MSRIVVLRENGAVSVLTEVKGIRSLVVNREAGQTPRIVLEGAPASVISVLNGIPKVLPERVKAIFEEVSAQRSLPAVSSATPESSPDERRLIVLLKHDGAPSILAGAPTLQILLVDRDQKSGAAQLQVEGAPATISTLYQVSPERIHHIFAELAPQIETVIGAPELVLKDRVQLAYLTRNWFSFEAA